MASRTQRQIALLKVLAAAAWADGRLDTEESNYIKRLILAYGLDQAELGEVFLLLEAPVSYERCEQLTRELLGMLMTQGERQEVLDAVEDLLRADGTFTDEEAEVLESLAGIMDAMSSVDGFISRITSVFRGVFSARAPGEDPGELTRFLKNGVLLRVGDLSRGAWRDQVDADTLNRYTLFGAVLGRIADLDGGVTPEELARIREILARRFSLEPPLLDWVVQAVAEASRAGADRQGLLAEYNRVSDMSERTELLKAAFAVAAADGVISETEAAELRTLSNFLWIDPRDFAEIRARGGVS